MAERADSQLRARIAYLGWACDIAMRLGAFAESKGDSQFAERCRDAARDYSRRAFDLVAPHG